jgi:hypothetical protein
MGQGLAAAVARQEARPPNFFTASLQRRGIILIVRGDPKDHEKLLRNFLAGLADQTLRLLEIGRQER